MYELPAQELHPRWGMRQLFNRQPILRHAAPVALFVAASTVFACEQAPDTTAEVLADLETIERVHENPDEFVGKRLLVAGEVEDVFSNRAFTVGGDDFLDRDLLVVTKQPIDAAKLRSADKPLWRDDIVQVNGEIRRLVTAEVERELGWDLEPEIEAEFDTRPILIAESVTIIPRGGGDERELTEGDDQRNKPQQQGEQQRPQKDDEQEGQARLPRANLGEPLRELTVLYTVVPVDLVIDRRVELENVKVRNVISDRGFWIGASGDQQLFVRLDPQPQTPGTPIEGKVHVEDDDEVDIQGTIRRVPARDVLEKEWGLDATHADRVSNDAFYLWATKVDTPGS